MSEEDIIDQRLTFLFNQGLTVAEIAFSVENIIISERHLRRRLVRFQLYWWCDYYCYQKIITYISVKGIY